jgi:hypothetical protein
MIVFLNREELVGNNVRRSLFLVADECTRPAFPRVIIRLAFVVLARRATEQAAPLGWGIGLTHDLSCMWQSR